MSNINYTSKYPKIVIDSIHNSVNESLAKRWTIEEFYDIMHHTHNIEDLVGSLENGGDYTEIKNTVAELIQTVNELKTENEELKKIIKEITDEISNMTSVGDWDVETPGIQDSQGNDLGTLMGFDMTEIG